MSRKIRKRSIFRASSGRAFCEMMMPLQAPAHAEASPSGAPTLLRLQTAPADEAAKVREDGDGVTMAAGSQRPAPAR